MEHSGENRPQREIVYVPASGYGFDRDDEIDLLDLWEIVWRGKWFIVGFTLLCSIIAVVVSFYVLTPKYKATATIRVSKESQDVIVPYLNSNKLKRDLIQEYDLLPVLFADRWDPDKQEWITTGDAAVPTVDVALSKEDFPLQASSKNDSRLVTLSWTGTYPERCSEMLGHVLKKLRSYMNSEFQSAALARINILKQDLQELQKLVQENGNMYPEVLPSIAGLQSKISELKGDDVLARRFSVIDDPITPQHPFEPNKKLIVALSCVLGLFVSIFLVFFGRFVHNARQRMEEKEAH